jgi:tRNA pseudouridine38-40 synthase
MQSRKRGDQTRKQVRRRRNIRLILAFDGTSYHGWQVQHGPPTIQETVRRAISRVTGERANIVGSGRTDAGTHARRLVASFVTTSQIPAAKFVPALNSILPPDIRVLSARAVPMGFHARYSACSKVYRYQIYTGPVLPPHLAREHFHYPYPIQIHLMREAVAEFVGEHDFASFAAGTPGRNTVRRIFSCELKRSGRRLTLTVEGNGFLHHMVRNMAGTLLEIGRGIMSMDDFRRLFEQRDRRRAGFTAPAHGLILVRVSY